MTVYILSVVTYFLIISNSTTFRMKWKHYILLLVFTYALSTIIDNLVSVMWKMLGMDVQLWLYALMIYNLVQDGDLSPQKGAERLNISIGELKARMLSCGYTFPFPE